MPKNPCCIISLKNGALLIGLIDVILSGMGLLGGAFVLGSFAYIHSIENGTIFHNVTQQVKSQHPDLVSEDIGDEKFFQLLCIVWGLLCVLSLLQMVFGCVLIHGIRKDKPTLLRLWIVFRACCFVLGIVLTISTVVLEKKKKAIGETAFDVVSSLLSVYFMYVVYTLYNVMMGELRQRPKPMRNQKYECYA